MGEASCVAAAVQKDTLATSSDHKLIKRLTTYPVFFTFIAQTQSDVPALLLAFALIIYQTVQWKTMYAYKYRNQKKAKYSKLKSRGACI